MKKEIQALIDQTNDKLRVQNKQEEDYPAWIVDYDFLKRGLIQGIKWYQAKDEQERLKLKDDTWAYGVLTGNAEINQAHLDELAQLDPRTIFVVFFDYIFDDQTEMENFDTVVKLKDMRKLHDMGFGLEREQTVTEFFKQLPQDYQLVNMPDFVITWTFDYRK